MSKNIIELLERRANEMRDGECWTIAHNIQSLDVNPYPRVRGIKIHRLAYEAHHAEPIPDDLDVLHTCNNTECFNPEHLYLGTDTDNARDRVNDGCCNLSVREYDWELFADLRDEQFTFDEISYITGADPKTIRHALASMCK